MSKLAMPLNKRLSEHSIFDTGIQNALERMDSAIIGQHNVAEKALCAFLASGHVLLEGVPGIGKTTLAFQLANVFAGSFNRIQMTSDLLPSEIIGYQRPNKKTGELEFQKGPIFAHFVLTDELNRTSPKTQAALLEAMAEGRVSVDGETLLLPSPFFVIATQNPAESYGVYPLSESQLDRFMLKLRMVTPDEEAERRIYQEAARPSGETGSLRIIDPTKPIFTIEQVEKIRRLVRQVHVDPDVIEYFHELLKRTRAHSEVRHGVSVRGGLQFMNASRALAFIRGRDYVSPDDIRSLAVPVMAHRLVLENGLMDEEPKANIVEEILKKTPSPV